MSVTASAITNPTSTNSTAATTTARTQGTSSLRRATVVAGLAAAGVTSVAAAAIHGAGVPLAVDGEMIPLAGFAQMTFLGAVIGGLLVAAFNRRSVVPRRRFAAVAAVLTALSCVPSVALPPDTATKASLVVLHLVAAALIVPVLARHANN